MGGFQKKVHPKVYDVVIVGSGAGGGLAVFTMANAGLKVALVEAGATYDPAQNCTQIEMAVRIFTPPDASTRFRRIGDVDAITGLGFIMM